MKISNFIIFILIVSVDFGCTKKCPPSSILPPPPIIPFFITDKDGNDLFFEDNSLYDPKNVKILYFNGEHYQTGIPIKFFYEEQGNYFELNFLSGGKSVYYIEFIPDKIDTIKIESHFVGSYEEPKGCIHFGIYENDFYFNDIEIFSDSPSVIIYKIEIK